MREIRTSGSLRGTPAGFGRRRSLLYRAPNSRNDDPSYSKPYTELESALKRELFKDQVKSALPMTPHCDAL